MPKGRALRLGELLKSGTPLLIKGEREAAVKPSVVFLIKFLREAIIQNLNIKIISVLISGKQTFKQDFYSNSFNLILL